MVAVLIENAARLSVPFLVKQGIDLGIPPIQAGEGAGKLIEIVVILLVMVAIQAVTRQLFLVMSGRVGQNVLLDLRRRMFGHFQDLSPEFHDEYTSGRVISRQTSDIDAIYELLETGFDGLITAVLTMVGTAVILLWLDLRLGLVSLLCFPFLYLLTRWFRQAVGDRLPPYPRDGGGRHRALRRDGQRHARRPGLPPPGPQPGDLRRRRRRLPGRQRARLPAGRRVHARNQADRQRHARGRSRVRRLPGLLRRHHGRHAGGVPALPAPVLRPDAGRLAVLQHVPVRLRGPGEALRACSRRSPRSRSRGSRRR